MVFFYSVDAHLSLKLLEPNDASVLFRVTDNSRVYLRQWLPWVDAIKHVEDTQHFIRMSMAQYAENNGFQAGVWWDRELMGCIGFHSIDWANRNTAIGYWLKESAQGQGIMTRATNALVKLAFYEYQLARVEIQVAVENAKSRAIPERLGFVQEGTLRHKEWLYDHFVDHVLYAVLAEDWLGSRDVMSGRTPAV